MHKSALCCLILTPTLIIPHTDGLTHPDGLDSVAEAIPTKSTDHTMEPKELFHVFGEFAALCYQVAESDAPQVVIATAKSIRDFYTVAQDHYNIERTQNAQVFASAADILPPDQKAGLLREIKTVWEAQNRDTIQAIIIQTT